MLMLTHMKTKIFHPRPAYYKECRLGLLKPLLFLCYGFMRTLSGCSASAAIKVELNMVLQNEQLCASCI